MSFARARGRLDSWQQRARALAIPIAVIKKFIDDGVDELGVQVAYSGFFSVFALLLVFASILGFVFERDPGSRRQLLDSTLERMPPIRTADQGRHRIADGSGVALAVGVGRESQGRDATTPDDPPDDA